MSAGGAGFEEVLLRQVISRNKCSGCSACVVSCPYFCLEVKEGKPQLKIECKHCGLCARVCTRLQCHLPKIEKRFFGRERKIEEEFGVYRRIAIARTKNDELFEVCQDGGLVTAILMLALSKKLIECAVVSGVSEKKPLYPVPVIASNIEQILACAGTRYFYSHNILALVGLERKCKSVGFVGTACQVNAIRQMEILKMKSVTSVKLVVGLMCSECFSYEGLMESYIATKMRINPNEVRRMDIKRKLLLTMKNGSVQSISLAEAKQYSASNCCFCGDFSAELADISAGGLGLNKWTLVVIRTAEGEKLFSAAEEAGVIETQDINAESDPLRLLRILSRRKRERATRAYALST